MLRRTILLLLLVLVAVIAMPFLVSALYIDWKGITIPGTVQAKREDVTVSYSTWKRSAEITIDYSKPDGSGVAFLKVSVDSTEYDRTRVGQPVSLQYLRKEDIPDLPLSKFFRKAQLLPTVHLKDHPAFSELRSKFTGGVVTAFGILAAVALLLLVWRVARMPGFAWAVAGCVVLGILATAISDFPRTLPPPITDVQHGTGTVKSLQQIDRLFGSSDDWGVEAAQPIDVVGIEFVPAGRTESVVAVDLIDSESIAGLKEKSTVEIDYERAAPRTAYLRGASRAFVWENLRGLVIQGLEYLAVLAVFGVAWIVLGRLYKRLVRRPS